MQRPGALRERGRFAVLLTTIVPQARQHPAWQEPDRRLSCLLSPSAPFRFACTRSRCLAACVMQTTQHREGNDLRFATNWTGYCFPRSGTCWLIAWCGREQLK